MITRLRPALLALLITLLCLPSVLAAKSKGPPDDGTRWLTWTNADGETVYLADNRQPSLYTQNFGDCLGGSSINVTRFDAAYYRDNMTVLFHLEGNTAIANESLVMYIGVFAYGESRFDLTFNPCSANILSLCPLNSSVPIVANGIIPIADSDVASIPSLAYSIPDFEGQAILRIFANSTESEIGCYTGVITNGNTFSQPKSVGSVLGICAAITLIASFATAIYGEAIPTMRLHYAHSLSVGVVFAVFQHVFFSGALSVNWPSVLVAWWSNFAWSGGMIYSSTMQNSINKLIGNEIGNTSQVGAAPAGSTADNLGGGYDISQIYARSLAAMKSRAGLPSGHPLRRDVASEMFSPNNHELFRRDMVERALFARDEIASKADGYNWYGQPVGSGLPLPGNYSGFAGTLATQNIRVSNAFMTGFLWFLILLVIVTFSVIAFKWTLEGLARIHRIKPDRLKFFRDHWRRYTTAVALRTCFIGFFLMMFLTIFEFTYTSSAGVKVVAAIVFLIFLVGIPGAAAYAVYYKKHFTGKDIASRAAVVEHKKLLGIIPVAPKKNATQAQSGELERVPEGKTSSKPFWKKRKDSMHSIENPADNVDNIHDYDDYTMKFGWLVSRFRRTKWYFFTIWIGYELLRAIFYGAASGYALAQVFGLLIIETLAFIYIIWAKPFEGRRLNVIVVYCLGFSKVASVGLSAAFDVNFNLARITTTVVGIVIIVIQGVLTVITMIAVVVGAVSSYMSVSRNREEFRPRKWHGAREKYFNHLDRVVNDLPKEKKTKVPQVAQAELVEPQEGFEMKGMRRLAKIEDEDEEFTSEMRSEDPNASYMSLANRAPSANASDAALNRPRSGTASPAARSRAASMQSQSNLPYGARPHRPSWNNRDFSPTDAEDTERSFTPIDMSRSVADEEPAAPPTAAKLHRHSRSASLTSGFSKPAPTVIRPQTSADALQVGGDVSTRDMIGKVPAPPQMRPRSSTHGSNRNSRSGTPLEYGDGYDGQPGSQRNSRYPLTPAQEKDEWGTPKNSQEDTQ